MGGSAGGSMLDDRRARYPSWRRATGGELGLQLLLGAAQVEVQGEEGKLRCFRARLAPAQLRDPPLLRGDLGLAIANHIVEEHRGTLVIESIEGSGTCITISLPAADGRSDSPAGPVREANGS